jgi:hypothetical protein
MAHPIDDAFGNNEDCQGNNEGKGKTEAAHALKIACRQSELHQISEAIRANSAAWGTYATE